MIYHDKVVAFLALCVATAASHSPHLGQIIYQDAPLLTIKDYAEPVLQERGSSLKRQDTVGSWALRATTCPSNTQKCDGGFTAMPPCCPKDSVCVSYLFRVACCSTSARCDITASTFPKCGDSSWTLWAGGHDKYFCCQSGEIGYITTDNSGACGPDSLKPTGTQVATSLVQNGGEVGGEQPPQTSAPTEDSPSSVPGNDGDGAPSAPTDPSSPGTSSPTTTENSPTNPTGTSRTSDNQNGDPDKTSNPTNSSSSSGSSGLPTGAIAGIAVGAVVLLILAGVAIYFALKAGKKKGAAEAMAAFQQQQRSLPGGDTFQSGFNTPGAVVPPMSPAPTPQGYGQQTQLKPDGTSVTAEKYGEAVPPNGPPPQWSASAEPQVGRRYEADATNTYPGANYAEMEGYNNGQRRY